MLKAMSAGSWFRKFFSKREPDSRFDLGDYRDQLRIMGKFGSLESMVNMIPGVAGQLRGVDMAAGELQLQRQAAMIDSMTPEERRHPEIIDWSRRIRIAEGSGCDETELAELLRRFDHMEDLMDRMKRWGDDDDDDPFTPLPA